MAISLAVKDHSQSRLAGVVSAYYPVARQDWGVLQPGANGSGGSIWSFANNCTDVGSGGSLAMSTTHFRITWVTANGESLGSVDTSAALSAGSDSVTIALGSVASTNVGAQLNAAPIIGWNVYSALTSACLKNTGTNSDLSTPSTLTGSTVTPAGTTITFIPIATTSITVLKLGNGAALPVVNNTGIQVPFPAIATNVSQDIFVKVPLSFSVGRATFWGRPNSTLDTLGTSIAAVDCVAPLWVASTAFNAGDFIVVGTSCFQCTVAGTTGTAPNVPAFSGVAKFGTIADNSATWTNVGSFRLLRVRVNNLSAATVQAVANEYDFWQ